MGFKFGLDAPTASDGGNGRVWPDGFIDGFAAYILSDGGQGYGLDASGKPSKTFAVRDMSADSPMIGTQKAADDCRRALCAHYVNAGQMTIPAGLEAPGAVFVKADGVPDHYVGLSVKSTSDYDGNADLPSEQRKFGIWVGRASGQAGKKKAKGNGNGSNGGTTATPNAG